MAENRIEIEIVLEDGKVAKGFADIEKQAKDSGAKAGDSFNDGVKSALGGLRGTLAGLAAAFAGAFAFSATTRAAAEQEQAIRDLNIALASAGRFSEDASKSFQSLANELQSQTGIADDVVLGYAKLATNYARTNEEAEKLVKASINLAAATGTDVDSALRTLGGSLSGIAGQLARTVPQIRGLTEEQLKAGEALRIVGARYDEIAAQQTKTFTGALTQVKVAFGEIVEAFGVATIKSKSLVAAFNFISEAFLKFAAQVTEFGSKGDLFKPFLDALIVLGKGINIFIIAPIEFVINIFTTLTVLVLSSLNKMASAFASFGATLASLIPTDTFKGISDDLSAFAQSSAITAEALREEFTDSFSQIPNLAVQSGISDFLNGLQVAVDTAPELVQQLSNSTGKGFADIGKQIKVVEFDLRTRIGNGIASVVQNTVTALKNGENAWKAFGKAVLGVFGDLAIQLGTFYIINGIAVEALNSISGTGAIAAGIALVALGALLKSFSGGSGSTSGNTTAGTPGVSGTPTDAQSPALTGEEQVERGTSVVVNVEGAILDPIGTGTKIAEILAEVGDSNDITVNA